VIAVIADIAVIGTENLLRIHADDRGSRRSNLVTANCRDRAQAIGYQFLLPILIA
jgi:hypothetical protein